MAKCCKCHRDFVGCTCISNELSEKEEAAERKCKERGCRNLEWKCADCGRSRATATMLYGQWISVEDGAPSAMETVLLCIKGKVLPGWNESTQPEEDPSYCTWEGEGFGAEGVTHWMPLPEAPRE